MIKPLAKPRVFFSTSGDLKSLIYDMRTVDQNRTQQEAEEFLQDCKAETGKRTGIPGAYWDRVRIFKVTVEEVRRIPPTERKQTKAKRAGGKP